MRHLRVMGPTACVFLGLSLLGCTGKVGTESGAEDTDQQSADDASNSGGTGAENGGSSAPTQPKSGPCLGKSTVGPAPLVRLTNRQYLNTVRDLFPSIAIPVDALALPPEVTTKGFSRVAEAQFPSAELVDELQRNAEVVAAAAVKDQAKLLPCQPTDAASESTCGRTFIAQFGKRAFRRPLSADETQRYEAFFDNARSAGGFSAAIEALITGFLQSPHFIYRPELGTKASATGVVSLSAYELASRLAYFLTDGPPDETLLTVAQNDGLADVKSLDAQARRLLGSPRAHELVAEFHRQWLQFDKANGIKKAPDLFPSFNDQMSQDLQASLKGYVDRLFWDSSGAPLQKLFTDNHALVNDALAPIYGVRPPGTTQLTWTEVPKDQRAGILTQAGLLAALAHERNDAPVKRGVFVLDRLLCSPPPTPPANINLGAANAPAGAAVTTRQMLETTHTGSTCVGCHRSIDGVGFGFSNYDALGAFRKTEAGQPVDARSKLVGTDVDGDFDGAVQLGQKLATSEQASRCVSTQWLAFALASANESLDECVVAPIFERFAVKSFDMRELLVVIATSDAFRFRPVANQ